MFDLKSSEPPTLLFTTHLSFIRATVYETMELAFSHLMFWPNLSYSYNLSAFGWLKMDGLSPASSNE